MSAKTTPKRKLTRAERKEIAAAIERAKRELHGRLSTFRGVKGSLELTAGGDLLFVPRRKRKEPVKIGNFDMVRQLWIIEDGKAGEYLCLD